MVSLKQNMYTRSLIITFIVLFIYISFIIYYLNNLVKCECYEDKDLKYLIYCEYAYLVLIFISCIIMYLTINLDSLNKNYLFIVYLIPILSLILYIYFIYATINVYKKTNINCLCSMSPIRYMLYIQAIVALFLFITTIFNIIKNKNLAIAYYNFKKKYNNNNNFDKIYKNITKK